MKVLVLDSALAHRTAAVVVDGEVVAARSEAGTTGGEPKGHETALPAMARDVLAEAGIDTTRDGALDLIATTVGPGSFTGIRACLALGHGLGLACGASVVGVTVGEAMASAFPRLGARTLWVATASRRGHIFLERGGRVLSLASDALPPAEGPVAVAGPAALQVAARLAGRGDDVLLTDARFPAPRHIALVAERRWRGELAPLEAWPLYVDPPEARPPAGGLRPPPVTAEP